MDGGREGRISDVSMITVMVREGRKERDVGREVKREKG